MSKIRIELFLVFLGLSLSWFACQQVVNEDKSLSETEKNAGKSGNLDTEVMEEDSIIYKVPSPIEMFDFLQNDALVYSANILNPVGNWESYTQYRQQAINLGIYTTDLAYTAAFEQYQESMLYFDLVRKLGQKVGVASVFDQQMINRIQNNLDNSDSLVTISSASYYSIIRHLEENNKGEALALISVGGWLEALYIVTSTIDSIAEYPRTSQRVAEQKLSLENLLGFLKQFPENEAINQTVKDIDSVLQVYKDIDYVEHTDYKAVEQDDKLFIEGGGVLQISQEKVDELKTIVQKLRSQYIGDSN